LAAKYAQSHKDTSLSIPQQQVEAEENRIYDGIFRGRGQVNPYEVRKELTDMMDAKAHIFRNEQDLSDGLRKLRGLKAASWKHVDDQTKEYNTNFINVMEIDSMLRVAEVILIGALNRRESRGSQSRTEYPKRDDLNFLKHTLAYHNDTGANNDRCAPDMEWYPVMFTHYAPVERHY
jgi:succinate dehydrogenase / fumarate reductase flavoprotein subunit